MGVEECLVFLDKILTDIKRCVVSLWITGTALGGVDCKLTTFPKSRAILLKAVDTLVPLVLLAVLSSKNQKEVIQLNC